MLRDVPMDAQVPALPDLAPGEAHRFLVMAVQVWRTQASWTIALPIEESASPKARASKSSTVISRVEHTRGIARFWELRFVALGLSIVLKQGPGATTATKSMPKPPRAQAVEPEPSPSLAQPVEAQNPTEEQGWKEVPRKRKPTRKPPSPPRPLNLKPKERPRKRWADWSDSGSDDIGFDLDEG